MAAILDNSHRKGRKGMKAKEGHRYYKERTRLETVIPLETPFILFVDPSSVCNLQCKFCPCGAAHNELWTEEKRKSIGFMEMETFKKVIDDCQDFKDKIKVLRMYKEGEPLLNPNFVDMLRYAKESGKFMSIDTTTNGTLLNPKLNRELMAAGLNRINISVDGLSSQEYEEVCGRKVDFEAFRANIKDLYEHKGDCHIFIKTVIGECSEEEAKAKKERFYELFGDICDEIACENLAPVWPGFDKEMYSETGIYGNSIQKRVVCARLFYILVINSDGEATPCLVDWNRKMIMGNVKDYTISQLWDKMRVYQVEHLKGNRFQMEGCRECLEVDVTAIDNIDEYREELLQRFI